MSTHSDPQNPSAHCDYCGRPRDEVGLLVPGANAMHPVAICRACITQAGNVLDAAEQQRPSSRDLLADIPTPKQVVEHLDRSVIGQGRAKRILSIAVSNHFVRLLDAIDRDSPNPIVSDAGLKYVAIEKSNVLLIGPSGSGKTHLARALAGSLGVPFAIADATSLTEAGYVGEDVESVLHNLLLAASWDVQAAQRGVVFIDEIDKLCGGRAHGTKDMRLGVQQALLTMIEGTVCNVPPNGGCKNPMEPGIPFDTSNVLFICGGAFGGLEEIVSRRMGRGAFGFDRPAGGLLEEQASLLRQVLPEDLERFGLIPELLGRLPVIATLDELGMEDLVRILQEPRNSLIGQYRKLLAYHGAELQFTDGAMREVAKIAFERGTGARGLRAVVEAVLEPALFDPEPWVTYRITEQAVRGGPIEKLDFLGLPSAPSKSSDPAAPLRHRVMRKQAGRS